MHKSVRVLDLAICRATVLANSYVPMALNFVCLIVLSCFTERHFADDIDLYTGEAVLASAGIPVSASPRARYKNQVYIGVFKPASAGRWQGNLKLYQIGIDKASGNQILLDADKKPAMDEDGMFFASSSRSFWTSDGDNPDGGSVVLGGVAQSLRQHVADNRVNLTCTGACTSFEPLAASNPNLDPTDFAVNSDEALAKLLAWIKQGHGDVVHSQPALIDYGEQKGLYAFYGSNDGMFHAVKVGTAEKTVQADAKDGEEQWAFTAPQHFRRLGQLYHAHLNQKSDKKFYFFDGPVASYVDTDKEGELRSAIIIVTARRGGRLVLAMDVTDPQSPVLLWQKSNHDRGFEELGQTWSKPVIKPIKLSTGKKVNALFMGLGYDPAADDLDAHDLGVARSQGRGLIVLDVLTGEIIWQKSDLAFSVPSDISVLDLDHNGFADRLYFGDSGGQLWRVSIADPRPSNWQIQRLLNLPNGQKFLNSPDVVRSSDGAYLAIIIGSGDREKPFDRDTQNYLISYRDYCVKSNDEVCTIPSASISNLQHIKVDKAKALPKNLLRGWYLTLDHGEKIVTRAVTLGGKTSIASYKSCERNLCETLGEARIYYFNPFTFTEDQDHRASHYRAIRGAGILPSPIAFAMESPLCVEGECAETQPPISGVTFGPYIQSTESSPLDGPVKLWWHRQ